ncbi:MAG: putative lipid II flippase FtsW [Clostridia bacterium]|nr:putative lipid II flippase FtsW [Clostridia bacterium]MBQ4608469.1 putative lipid II flippase FtsW [Clostridia bacterium]MBQ6858263.1 putative lipid II flippase FtsW [Clostridia bacterium]MBQ7051766.1 putative lipid II flippase FtsW [Clostridia bacterium]
MIRPEKARRTCDKSVVVLMVLLLVLGLVTLFSATYYQRAASGDALSAVKKQLLGVGLGAAACAFLSRVPYRVFRRGRVMAFLLAVSFVLLTLVIIPGIGVSINGSRRWLNILGLSMQPSEFAKYAMVIFMAGALDRRADEIGSLFRCVVPLLIVPGVMFLLILEQPNLSTGGSILICALVMLIAAGLKKRHMALLSVCGLCVGAFYAWSAPYRRERLLSFRDPFAKMSDEGYQLSQSLIALGSGGLFGMGLGQGRQKFAYLPYPESDFIFAIVGEDFGLAGCLLVLFMFAAFVFAGLRLALGCRDRYGALLAAGITSMIGLQALINMGVVTGIMPTTGLPLPFFSAGGTSVTMIMAAVGILLNISRGNGRLIADGQYPREERKHL